MASPSIPFASDLSLDVLEMRRRRGEINTPELDDLHRGLQPGYVAVRWVHRTSDDAEPVLPNGDGHVSHQ